MRREGEGRGRRGQRQIIDIHFIVYNVVIEKV